MYLPLENEIAFDFSRLSRVISRESPDWQAGDQSKTAAEGGESRMPFKSA